MSGQNLQISSGLKVCQKKIRLSHKFLLKSARVSIKKEYLYSNKKPKVVKDKNLNRVKNTKKKYDIL